MGLPPGPVASPNRPQISRRLMCEWMNFVNVVKDCIPI